MFSIFIVHSFILLCPAAPILVTDQNDSESSQFKDVIAVSPAEQAVFRDSGDLLQLISNANSVGGTNRLRFFQLRGVGEGSQYENTPTHAITYLVEGVDLTGIMAHWPLLEVDQVAVDKIPRSVGYGGQAMGGVVSTSLTRTGDDYRVRLSGDERGGHAADASAPLGSHRLAVHYNSDPGYIENSVYGKPGDSRHEVYASLVSDWMMTPAGSVQTTLLGAQLRNRYDVWSLNNSLETFSDHPGKDNLDMVGGSLTIRRTFSPNLDVEVWSSLVASEALYSYDSDWGSNPYWQTVPGWNAVYDYFDQFQRQRCQLQQRFTLNMAHFQFAVHAQNLNENSSTASFKNGVQRSVVDGRYRQNSAAVHARYVRKWHSRWEWRLAARYDSVQTRFTDFQSVHERERSPQMAAESRWRYTWNEDHQSQFSVSRGYKNPIINIDPDTPTIDRRVGSESALHWELGHSLKTAEGQFQIAAFVRDGRDQQVRVSRQLDPVDPSTFVYYYDNAATTRYWGYEFSGDHLFANRQRWRWSLGLLQAQFREYVFSGQVLSGRNIANAPKSTWAVQWGQPISRTWTLIMQGEGRSAFYFSNNHGQKSESYQLLHAALQWSSGAHQWDLGVRNVFDRRFATRAFFFANEPPDFAEKLYLQYGTPRTIYMNYRARF